MANPAFEYLQQAARRSDALEESIRYMAQNMRFLKPGEPVLICFAKDKPACIGEMMEQAVLRCGAKPVLVGKDWRWKNILWLAFSSRASTIIAPPLIVLGLLKLAKYKGTPLGLRNVVMSGYPAQDWMIDGIIQGLDCKTWGCFCSREGAVIAGFSCGQSRGVHIRDELYEIRIVDDAGRELPEGEVGEMVLYSRDRMDLPYHLGERARLNRTPCACGCSAPRLMDINYGSLTNQDLAPLGQYLQNWTSVLDCRLKKSNYGLEMEIITFPGEKLPKLPSAAKQVLRPWNPEKDEPFFYSPGIENT